MTGQSKKPAEDEAHGPSTAAPTTGSAERPRGRVTMRHVATAAGVSIQTVSNVINGRSARTAPETAARVRAVLEELQFHPNVAARSLRSARSRTLAFLVLDAAPRFLADPTIDQFLAGLGDETRDRAYAVLINGGRPGIAFEALVEPLMQARADGGIVLLSGDAALRRHYRERLSELTTPYLLLQEHSVEGLNEPSVYADDREGSRKLCEHLIATGHTRIGFLTAAYSWSAIEERIDGYRDAHRAAGLELDESLIVRAGEFGALEAAVAASDLLERASRPTAVMCGNDLVALGVAKAARDRALRIPDTLAITGFNDFDFARAVDPPLTTTRIPGYDMGRHAAAALIEGVERNRAIRSRRFPTEVFLRGSA